MDIASPPEAAVSAPAGPVQPIAIPAQNAPGTMTTPRPGSARRPSRFSDQAERASPGQRSPSARSQRPPSAPSARMADRPPSGSKRRASESEPAPLDAEGAGAAGQRAAAAGSSGASGVPRMQVPQPACIAAPDSWRCRAEDWWWWGHRQRPQRAGVTFALLAMHGPSWRWCAGLPCSSLLWRCAVPSSSTSQRQAAPPVASASPAEVGSKKCAAATHPLHTSTTQVDSWALLVHPQDMTDWSHACFTPHILTPVVLPLQEAGEVAAMLARHAAASGSGQPSGHLVMMFTVYHQQERPCGRLCLAFLAVPQRGEWQGHMPGDLMTLQAALHSLSCAEPEPGLWG